ncbi:hypothetical protein [Aliidongia dinghuensis]|nr:hypothetical protein [Aliidongia dinghuensis]
MAPLSLGSSPHAWAEAPFAVAFLASGAARSVTGDTLRVDGAG